MKKDGKLFGKISLIDLAAILVVITMICGLGVRFFSNDNRISVANVEPMECVVKVHHVRQYNVDALAKGGEVYDRTTKEYLGKITGVRSEPATTMLLLTDGTYHEVPVEDRYNVFVTLAFDGKEGTEGYFTSTNRQLSVGSNLNMDAKYSQCDGSVVEIRKAGQ